MESTTTGWQPDELRGAVVAAAQDELIEHGYDGLAVDRVAQRAEVAAGAVRARWADGDALIELLLDEFAEHDLVLPNSGSLETDLRALAAGIAAFYAQPRRRATISALVHAAGRDPRAAVTLREFFARRTARAAEPVRRAIARGELPPETDPVEVIRALGAPFYYRMFITLEPLDASLGERSAAAALAAARAGALTA